MPSLRWAGTVVGGGVLVAMLVLAGEALAQQRVGAEPTVPAAASDGERAVAEALERWDIPAASAALAALPAPRGPVDLLLESRLAFLRGDSAGAARLAADFPAAIRDQRGVAAFVRLVEATLAMEGRLARRESEHFVLSYDLGRDWVLVEPALEALESGYRALGGWLGARPPQKVRVQIVPSAEDFARVSGLASGEIETAGAVGICAFNKIMVLSPRLLLRGYPWRDALNHEYLHYLLAGLSGNRAPIWLQEGVARYAESRWRSGEPAFLDDVDRSLLARALRENRLLAFADMDPTLVRLPTMGAVRLAFAECALAAEHLLDTWGVEGLRRLLAALADQQAAGGVDEAMRTALGTTLAGFEQGWRAALASRKFVEVEGLGIPAYRLAGAGAGDAEAWDLADWQPLEAQNHLRLGDMLRARNNPRAGLSEYQRALKIAPASPYAHLKRARALLELGRADEAAGSAREAVRLAGAYPAAHEVLAEALARLGDSSGAAEALRAALELNPFNPFAWRDLGRALRALGQTAEAQRAGVIALRLGPGDEKFQRSVMESP